MIRRPLDRELLRRDRHLAQSRHHGAKLHQSPDTFQYSHVRPTDFLRAQANINEHTLESTE